jgi:alkanesulfonate monooxygenase SsuD/methylene tetrahydromethanopterin reductase-like flavin-dependent oxidoreductase (luciferase family)
MTKLGVVLPTTNRSVDPHGLVAFAREAEQLGFSSLWAGDTILRPVLEPLSVLAAVATATDRVMLGTAALLPALRRPVPSAQALASLDQLSGGRLTLAVGAGFPGRSEVEYAAAGVPWERRFARLDDTVALWRQLWSTQAETSYQGEVLRYDRLPVPIPPAQPGGPPLWLAGASPSALVRTGRLYDGWLPYPPTPDAYATGLAAVRTAAAGRDVTPALFVTLHVAESGGREALAEFAQASYGRPLEAVETIQLLIAGPLEHIRAELARYADARHLVVRIGALDLATQRVQLERIAKL